MMQYLNGSGSNFDGYFRVFVREFERVVENFEVFVE